MISLADSAVIAFEYFVHHGAKVMFVWPAHFSQSFFEYFLWEVAFLEFGAIGQVLKELKEIVDDVYVENFFVNNLLDQKLFYVVQ